MFLAKCVGAGHQDAAAAECSPRALVPMFLYQSRLGRLRSRSRPFRDVLLRCPDFAMPGQIRNRIVQSYNWLGDGWSRE